MPSGRDLVTLLIVLGACALLRYLAIEPVEIRHACGAAPWDGWCALRTLAMLPFRHREIGWFALLCSIAGYGILVGAVSRARADSGAAASRLSARLARTGLFAGAAGLVLYSADPAAVATLLSAVTLGRLRARAQSAPAVASA